VAADDPISLNAHHCGLLESIWHFGPAVRDILINAQQPLLYRPSFDMSHSTDTETMTRTVLTQLVARWALVRDEVVIAPDAATVITVPATQSELTRSAAAIRRRALARLVLVDGIATAS